MILNENKYANGSGTFPDFLMDDATGAGLTDGSEFAALPQNDGWEAVSQAIMDYAAGGVNAPTGSVGVPNGVSEAKGVSQILQAIQQAHGIGPGNYVQWANDDDPSVTGDRVILLAEQGVLIAVYPELDDRNWIGGNTAAQVAAEAAGQKFYRSSDAPGLVGDAAGPYLQLPPNFTPSFFKQYSEGVTPGLAVTGANWTTARAVLIPYKTVDGTWRLIFNIVGGLSSTTSTFTGTISGVVFKNVAGYEQSMSMSQQNASRMMRAWAIENTSNFGFITDNVVSLDLSFSGDVELDSKPTWADDFEIKWGIRY